MKYYLNIVCKQTLKQLYSKEIDFDTVRKIVFEKYEKFFKTIFKFCIILIILLILSIVGFIVYSNYSSNKLKEKENKIKELETYILKQENEFHLNHLIGTYITYKGSNEINDSLVYNFIKQTKAWYPEIIYAQYKIESASGTSKVFKESNNLFGMKKVYKRNTTQIPNQDYNSYGVYHNWQCSILDRVLWDIYIFKEKPSKEEYLNSLKIYAEDPNYINKINKIIKL